MGDEVVGEYYRLPDKKVEVDAEVQKAIVCLLHTTGSSSYLQAVVCLGS